MIPWRGRRVLVTGAGGFIGARLAQRLAVAGAHMRAHSRSDGNLLEPAVCRQAVRGAEVVFHLASAPGSRDFVERHPMRVWENVVLDARVVRAAAAARVRLLIFASSANVYPRKIKELGRPLAEEMAGPPYEPDGAFGWTKLTTEKMLADSRRETGLRSVACRLFPVYGPGAPDDNAVAVWIRRALRGAELEAWGGGQQRRSWLHVDDAVDGLLLAARADRGVTALNLGGAQAYSVNEVIAAILRLSSGTLSTPGGGAFPRRRSAGRTGARRGPDRNAGVGHQVADISRARSLGWRPTISLLEGLRRTLEWNLRRKFPHQEAAAARRSQPAACETKSRSSSLLPTR